MTFAVTEHIAKSSRHTTFYLSCGAEDAPPIIFVHGWPELSISWRHQLPAFAALGFRAVAPDMRGYGRSSVYSRNADYAQEHIVRDMLELLDSLNSKSAIWVGHDWGSPVVWNLASHHPDRCAGIASLCVPYYTLERGLDHTLTLVDRKLYPETEYPAAQWTYMRQYEENFAAAIAPMDADAGKFLRPAFRKGDPAGEGKPTIWEPVGAIYPEVPRDDDIVNQRDLSIYVSALERNGFFGPTSWYMNHPANAEYAKSARNDGYLEMPVLFLNAQYDYICECTHSR